MAPDLIRDELRWQRRLVRDLLAAIRRGELTTMKPVESARRRIQSLTAAIERRPPS